MKKYLLILIFILFATGILPLGSAYAADIVYSESDCADILDRWASDPDSVPAHLVDECKKIMAAAAPAEDSVPDIVPFAGTQKATDPCAGPGAAGSIHCWGPWSAIAPAASGDSPTDNLLPVDDYDVRPELAEQFEPIITGSCAAGTPCGFATIVDGTSGQAPGSETTIAQFDLAGDGTQFTVAPGEAGEIASVGMTPAFINRPDGYENMRAGGLDGDLASRLIARVIRDSDGNIILAADAWAHGNRATQTANSGFFAWGMSMPQGDVNALNSAAVSAVFSGPMSVDNTTAASLTLNFGANPTWTGGWTNPDYSFDAGGTLVGVNLISDPAQFSDNVGADSFVQGALLGDIANKSIAHVIDVDIAGVGRIRDVGLLREPAGLPIE